MNKEVKSKIENLALQWIKTLDGYNSLNIDPATVLLKLPMIVSIKFESSLRRVAAEFVQVGVNKYNIVIHEESENFVSLTWNEAVSCGIEKDKSKYYRHRFTLAHELGHIFFEKYKNIILCICGTGHFFSSKKQEGICDLFASIFLMPKEILASRIREYYKETANYIPKDILKNLSEYFKVNIRTILLRISNTGVAAEYPWCILLFQYRFNPGKTEPLKWRLSPGYVVLPNGLKTSSGLYYTGIDTLYFCCSGEKKRSDWVWYWEKHKRIRREINEFQKFMFASEVLHGRLDSYFKFNNVSFNEIDNTWSFIKELEQKKAIQEIHKRQSWYELNPITGPRGGMERNIICFHPNSEGYDPPFSLFAHLRNPPVNLKEVTNKDFRIEAEVPYVLGWKRSNDYRYMLFITLLRAHPRSK